GVHGGSAENPAHMRPPSAFGWGVGVAFVVGELVMHAMRGHPEDGSTFERKRGSDGHEVLDPLAGLVSAMGEQPVIAHADADVGGVDPEHYGADERSPAKHEERGDGSDMEEHHEDGGDDTQSAALGGAAEGRYFVVRSHSSGCSCGAGDRE